MAYKVFVSYPTKYIQIAQWAIQTLSRPGITDVFVAEYSLEPGAVLDERILAEIRACDLFVVLWGQAAHQSNWVPAEIGAARMAGKTIVPVVLEANVPVPGFIAQVKHIRAYENWEASLANLKQFVDTQALELAERQKAGIVLALILGGIWLLSR